MNDFNIPTRIDKQIYFHSILDHVIINIAITIAVTNVKISYNKIMNSIMNVLYLYNTFFRKEPYGTTTVNTRYLKAKTGSGLKPTKT